MKRADGFVKQEITEKSARTRFNLLLENHRTSEKVSATASGIFEKYTEKQQFLDELILVVDEHVLVDAKEHLQRGRRLRRTKIQAD